MKKRSFRYDEGGDVDALEEANKGESLDTTPGPKAEAESEKSKGFKEAFRDARSAGDKTFTWQGKKYTTELAGNKTVPPSGIPGGAYRGQRAEAPAPKASSAEIPKSAASQSSRAVIPGGGQETEVEKPTSASRMREGMSDTVKKALAVSGAGALGTLGLGLGYKAYKASDAAKRAQIAKAIRKGAESAPITGGSTAARTTSETGRKFSPKAEMEAAESTMRGAVGRRDIQAKRAAKERSDSAEGKSSGRTGSTGAPRSRNTVGRDEEMTSRNFSSGGKVRGGGCEQRGLRKCKVM